MNDNINATKDLLLRIVRLETKLVRGFSEMGIDLDEDNWISIDNKKRNVYINTLGRSLKVILKTMEKHGIKDYGEEFDVYYKEQYFGTIVYDLEHLK